MATLQDILSSLLGYPAPATAPAASQTTYGPPRSSQTGYTVDPTLAAAREGRLQDASPAGAAAGGFIDSLRGQMFERTPRPGNAYEVGQAIRGGVVEPLADAGRAVATGAGDVFAGIAGRPPRTGTIAGDLATRQAEARGIAGLAPPGTRATTPFVPPGMFQQAVATARALYNAQPQAERQTGASNIPVRQPLGRFLEETAARHTVESEPIRLRMQARARGLRTERQIQGYIDSVLGKREADAATKIRNEYLAEERRLDREAQIEIARMDAEDGNMSFADRLAFAKYSQERADKELSEQERKALYASDEWQRYTAISRKKNPSKDEQQELVRLGEALDRIMETMRL